SARQPDRHDRLLASRPLGSRRHPLLPDLAPPRPGRRLPGPSPQPPPPRRCFPEIHLRSPGRNRPPAGHASNAHLGSAPSSCVGSAPSSCVGADALILRRGRRPRLPRRAKLAVLRNASGSVYVFDPHARPTQNPPRSLRQFSASLRFKTFKSLSPDIDRSTNYPAVRK